MGCAKAETAPSCFTACNDGDRGRPVIVLLPNINQKISFGGPKKLARQKRRGKNFGAVFLDVFSLPEFKSGLSLAPKTHFQAL